MVDNHLVEIERSSEKRPLFELIFWLLLAILAGQRFLLPAISSNICVIPLVLAIGSFFSNPKRSNSLLILALFWSVDNVAVGSDGTYYLLRYAIYVSALASFMRFASISLPRSALLVFTLAGYLMLTMFNLDLFNEGQFQRDIIIFILVVTLFLGKKIRPYEIDFEFLFMPFCAFLAAELVNFFFLKSAWFGDYMNYDTTKYLITMPSIYAIFSRRVHVAAILVALTIPVLVGYTTRMILVTYAIVLIASYIFMPLRKRFPKKIIIGFMILALIWGVAQLSREFLESYKALNLINIILQSGASLGETLAPVRYSEHVLFFRRTLGEITFGNGFGSGIFDSQGEMAFVSLGQTAFSREELSSNIYVNFHDMWIDVGLRFGLLPLALFIVWILRQYSFRSPERRVIFYCAILALLCSFYSVAGLLTLFAFLHSLNSPTNSSE